MEIYLGIIIFIFGAILGSFLGCMGYRIPNKIKTTYPSSFCPNCKKPLKWYMNIPIISFICLKGRCAYCKKEIGIIYFICEFLCACLFLLNYLVFDLSFEFVISIILTCVLITVIVSDFLYYYISDRVLIIAGLLALITIYLMEPVSVLYERLISGVVILLIMIGLKILGNNMFGEESLGDGDIKLMAVIAISLGWRGSFIALFFASVTALIYALINIKKKNRLVPFGPFIISGALLMMYFSNIINAYLDSLL